ncbi:MAG: excinuclease ABC subunit UvrC [Gammaproteobacteria bacterium]|nr:excinuclease ABC subunit UvrC [Gammaproteobacteria bacterium]
MSNSFDHRAFLARLTSSPGVYQMLDGDNAIIYVGKAKNLKKRVSSYFRSSGIAPKTAALVAQIANIEIITTHTEGEALLLENSLIKKHRPRYNILLRDDKSYPYIFLSDHPYPRLTIHRGTRRKKGRYFGPYPSAGAVRESLGLLQKIFPVRQCEDQFYKNRSRACLQYQIERCSAPCVGYISEEAYAEDVRHTVMFLRGEQSIVIDELVEQMGQASGQLEFEKAALIRDQISHLRRVQERQHVVSQSGDLDVIAAAEKGGVGIIQIFNIRDGQNLGNKSFFPAHTRGTETEEMLSAFISQYYLIDEDGAGQRKIPPQILINHEFEERSLLEQVLTEQLGKRVEIRRPKRGEWMHWIEMAERNADQALSTHLTRKESLRGQFEAVAKALNLDEDPQRIECFDISHTMGEATVASCVVFGREGAIKSDYRRYNIEGITGGDDYAAMRQALERRYQRLKEGGDDAKWPDLLLIDGGLGQLRQAESVMNELQLVGITMVGVAKGETRKPGLEQLILSGQPQPIILPADSPALHLIQQVRDEAHRFAITGHRQRRDKKRKTSPLETIPGLGPKRRQLLLKQFGGLQEVARAGIEDLQRIKGISRKLAVEIYDTFHPKL